MKHHDLSLPNQSRRRVGIACTAAVCLAMAPLAQAHHG